MFRTFAKRTLITMLVAGLPHAGMSQTIANTATRGMDEIDGDSLGLRQGSFIVAPIPLKDPTVGTGLVLGGGFLFQTDEGSDTSFIGLGGMKTDNGTNGYAVIGNFALSNNTWKFGFTAGTIDAFYDLYLLGRPVPVHQSGILANAHIAYGITPDISVGTEMRYLETSLYPGGRLGSLPISVPLDGDLGIFSLGLTFDYDTRDDTIYPTEGTHVSTLASFSTVVKGRDRDYEKARILVDHYVPLFQRSVLALRAATCATSGRTPFFDRCTLGGDDGFRGYPALQYYDTNLVSAQAEFRGQVFNRFGYSVFGGVGAVAPVYGDLFNSQYQMAGGIGVRYRLSKKFPLDFAVDAAVNQDGERTTYIYVGQRF